MHIFNIYFLINNAFLWFITTSLFINFNSLGVINKATVLIINIIVISVLDLITNVIARVFYKPKYELTFLSDIDPKFLDNEYKQFENKDGKVQF